MDPTALHLEIRNGLSLADELSRYEHAFGDDGFAGRLAALRSSLAELEREIGRDHEALVEPSLDTVERVERALQALLIRREARPADASIAPRLEELIASAERVSLALWGPDVRVPSKPLGGVLPLARVVPQEAHTLLDVLAAGACAASAFFAKTTRARVAGTILGAKHVTVAALTDTRASAAKVIPIEVHETADLAFGAAAALAPFALGYFKKDPVASALQIAAGLGLMVASLFTDYRAAKGWTFPLRSKGGPGAAERHRHGAKGIRVPEVQRPLEGLASAPSAFRVDIELTKSEDDGFEF